MRKTPQPVVAAVLRRLYLRATIKRRLDRKPRASVPAARGQDSSIMVGLTRLDRVACIALLVAGLGSLASAQSAAAPVLLDAQRQFYDARYDDAAELTQALRQAKPDDLATIELRTSALLFQIRRLLGAAPDKDKAFKACAACQDIMKAFLTEVDTGVALARARLKTNPADETAQFFLGKLNLNWVWLQLGTLGRRTGWDQYWEARKSLDAVLKRNPQHVRARLARAWIDYIVDTRMPRGTRWLLGGGNRKKALLSVAEAAKAEAEFFVHVEAEFALWDLHVRERNIPEATVVARRLAIDFPQNREVASFLEAHDPNRRP